MRLSEKSLELNVGAEILGLLRAKPGFEKAYLRGLTQQEEKQEGVDCFAQLDPATAYLAFQFKAPKGKVEGVPYRFTINREQHQRLYALAFNNPQTVFYTLPFYVTPQKLQADLPSLAADTWLLDVSQMETAAVFGTKKSATVSCAAGQATINPRFPIIQLATLSDLKLTGLNQQEFLFWYDLQREHVDSVTGRRNPAAFRGTRMMIVPPKGSSA